MVDLYAIPTIQVETASGIFTVPDLPGDVVVQAMKRGEVWDAEVVEVAREVVKPGDTVVDVGGCFGQHAVEFARLVGRDGEVLCFEPRKYLAELIEKNTLMNGTNIAVVQAAAWNEDRGMSLQEVDFKRFSSVGSYGVDPRGVISEVPALRVDYFDLTDVSFIKVDAQGSDLKVLQGARETILRCNPVVVFEFEPEFKEEFGYCWEDFVKYFEEVDYKLEEIGGGNWKASKR